MLEFSPDTGSGPADHMPFIFVPYLRRAHEARKLNSICSYEIIMSYCTVCNHRIWMECNRTLCPMEVVQVPNNFLGKSQWSSQKMWLKFPIVLTLFLQNYTCNSLGEGVYDFIGSMSLATFKICGPIVSISNFTCNYDRWIGLWTVLLN